MNERIKELRKALGLTLEEFGAKIGMGKSSVSKIEKGLNGTTDQTIRSICREFKVSEDWLRTGEGDMFDQEQPSILARLSSEYKLTAREQSVVAAFLELDEADRAAIMRYVDKLVEKLSPSPAVGDSAAEAVAAVRDYLDMVADEKNTEGGSSTSAG